jgi:competence protein ComEA
MYKNLNYSNFTKNELKVIIFVIIVLFSGFCIKYMNFLTEDGSKSRFNYSQSEVTFKKLSKGSVNSIANDSLIKTDSVNISEIKLIQQLRTTEDSLKSKERKKSKKEEKLKPKSINLNTATKEILVGLPGVGESTAEKIVKYRETHNGFKKIENIMKVKGIGKKKFERIKDYIYIE